jgi:hypothetical protein
MSKKGNAPYLLGFILSTTLACGGRAHFGDEGDGPDGGAAGSVPGTTVTTGSSGATSGGAGGSSSTTSGNVTTGPGATTVSVGTGGGTAGAGGSIQVGTGGQGGTSPSTPPVVHCPGEVLPSFADDAGQAVAPPPPATCPCTRRPGPGNSLFCPEGHGDFVTAVIDEAGGTIGLSGTMSTRGVPTRLEIPRGALPGPTTISITETSCPPPASFIDGSPVYQFDPPDLVFASAVVLTIGWSIDNGVVPDLAIYSNGGGIFEKIPMQNGNAGFIQARVTKLAQDYFVGVPKQPSQQSCP